MRFLLAMLTVATVGPAPDLQIIDRFDDCVQTRFVQPLPETLGMSRIFRPSSFGRHFQPNLTTERDFQPENPTEAKILAALEQQHIQLGVYLFGVAIGKEDPQTLSYRALKGPAIVTKGTPRFGSIPGWNTVYPIASRAMKSFQDGGAGFETTLGSWTVAARPVIASRETCVGCHNRSVEINQPIGGLIYAFKRTTGPAPE